MRSAPRGAARHLLATLAALALLVGGPAGLSAQGQGGPGGGFKLSVTPTNISFPTPGAIEFNQGHVDFTGVDVTIDTGGGKNWILEIKADNADLGGYGKPLSDLEFYPPGGPWTSISNTYQTVTTGSGTTTVTVDFRMNLFYSRDVPDTYSTGITFRVRKP